MEKKTYKTPCMKVRRITCTHILCTSGGENNLRMFKGEQIDKLEEEYSQW